MIRILILLALNHLLTTLLEKPSCDESLVSSQAIEDEGLPCPSFHSSTDRMRRQREFEMKIFYSSHNVASSSLFEEMGKFNSPGHLPDNLKILIGFFKPQEVREREREKKSQRWKEIFQDLFLHFKHLFPFLTLRSFSDNTNFLTLFFFKKNKTIGLSYTLFPRDGGC